MDILLIKPEWGEKILAGEKTWEIRGASTSKRGTIALAYSKTGKKFGEVELADCIALTRDLWENGQQKHCAPHISWDELLQMYKKPYAWVMKNPIKYKEPVPYTHRHGAVIWVKE